MKKLEDLINKERLTLKRCYCNYEKVGDKIIIKKTDKMVSSSIQVKEMLDLREAVDTLENIEFSLLENEDIVIKMK